MGMSNNEIVDSAIEKEIAALPEGRPTWTGERPKCIGENGEPDTNYWDSGTEYDKLRTPKGFIFHSNMIPESESLIEWFHKYMNDPNYIMYRNAYEAGGSKLRNGVVIFRKIKE